MNKCQIIVCNYCKTNHIKCDNLKRCLQCVKKNHTCVRSANSKKNKKDDRNIPMTKLDILVHVAINMLNED